MSTSGSPSSSSKADMTQPVISSSSSSATSSTKPTSTTQSSAAQATQRYITPDPCPSSHFVNTVLTNPSKDAASTPSSLKSPLAAAFGKAKAKIGELHERRGSRDKLPSDEAEFERMRAKEQEKERRREEYERLGLGDKTKFGAGGCEFWSVIEAR
ncbi:hypothetical protein NA57DRAFT_55252 [Rhizodiscina lignyota]|uniref:Uncharacterized protein n=1 Tax=Rhizodiscina lignyota TaxID=1504668 RepID=A0A9P4MB17_9PEZI|nr:hypothetical protein NA57DRAFT_55252 [Rhizodiscina lignyota]